jgi:hypothetical protein
MSEFHLHLSLKPVHPYYAPSQGFIERYNLHITEACGWVYYQDHPDDREATKFVALWPETGRLVLAKQDPSTPGGDLNNVFDGYLPSEEALEQVIQWTKW